MSHWIRFTERVRMTKGYEQSDKTSIHESDDILRGRSQKVRREIKLVDSKHGPPSFFEACKWAKIEPTRRQLSKWKGRRGRAWQVHKAGSAA